MNSTFQDSLLLYDAAPWYALYVRARHEKRVQAHLEAHQQQVFLPLYISRHRWADRWKTVSLPLFPGYVFCRFNAESQYSILVSSGIIDVVKVGSKPAAIEASEIRAIQLIVNSQLSAEPYTQLARGEKVLMIDGPLTGLSGTLVEIKNSLRLVISVALLHRSVMVEIDREWVIPTSPSKPGYPQVFTQT